MTTGSPFSWGTRVLAGGALLFVLVLVGGALLPGTWSATASRTVAASPDAVLALLDSPEGWQAWTPWPEAGLEREGPERGEGAVLRWAHPNLGDGAFEIVSVEPGRAVAYVVRVEEGSMITRGRVELEPTGGGTRVTWREEGDFGWNPLMGYWALAMERVQGGELEKGLERLEEAAVDRGASTP
jgi:carbon monoxide dehydrogenase subunit G